MLEYKEFLKTKDKYFTSSGFNIDRKKLNKNLFEYQKDVVIWALNKGRAALFEGCGLGKTIQQLEWSHQIHKHTGEKVLILTPLSVAKQTVREGLKFGIEANYCRSQEEVKPGINITNYEMLHKFNTKDFIGIVLDESSILKSFTGKFRNDLIEAFKYTPYRLCCTATPAPNDYVELGNHSEFLGIMTRVEMLSMYFIHDGGDTSKWRLKGHAEDKYWEWMSTWSVVIDSPKDLGYMDYKFELPSLNIHDVIVKTEEELEQLIPTLALTLTERREARKNSINTRLEKAMQLTNNSEEQWLVWCDFNYESEVLSKSLSGAVEVKGSDKPEHKEVAGLDFADGKIKVLVSKSSIYGFGMNWQQCSNILFFGLSDSYEQFYQAIRRCWRFGQTKDVNVYVIIGEREITVLDNIKRKQIDAEKMKANMIKYAKNIRELKEYKKVETKKYIPNIKMSIPSWI